MFDHVKLLLETYPNGGWFVEAGAHDGVGDSQTLALERAGWRGLCVEASSYWTGMLQSRQCFVSDACLGERDGETVQFREVHEGNIELSGIVGSFNDDIERTDWKHIDVVRRTVNLTTLMTMYRLPPVIQFLSLDNMKGRNWTCCAVTSSTDTGSC